MVASNFTTSRMIRDYQERFYLPQYSRTQKLLDNNFQVAKELSEWKYWVSTVWNKIEIIDVKIAHGITNLMKIGQDYPARVVVDLKGLTSKDVGLELVITTNGNSQPIKLVEKMEFRVESCVGSTATFFLDVHIQKSGTYSYGLRLFPKNENLLHRQDFRYVKWL